MVSKTLAYWIICTLVISAILACSLATKQSNEGNVPEVPEGVKAKTFSSYDELKEYIIESIKLSKVMSKMGLVIAPSPARVFLPEITPMPTPIPSPVPLTPAPELVVTLESTLKATYGTASRSYSKTNIQVEGVDEADIVKTDGKYLYVASGDKVYIVKAYPPENTAMIAKIEEGHVLGLFVKDGRLVAITARKPIVKPISPQPLPPIIPEKSLIYPVEGLVSVIVYDIENPREPTVFQEINVTGYYVTSRLVDNYCYIIVSFPALIIEDRVPLPLVNSKPVEPNEIKCFEKDFSYAFTVIIAVNVETGEFRKETFLTGASNYIYMTHKNLYVLSRKQLNIYAVLNEIVDSIVEKAPDDVKEVIEDIRSKSINEIEKYKLIMEVLEQYFNKLPHDEREKIFNNVLKEVYKLWKEETVIYKFAINGLNITASAKGVVPGRVLDQFSMDEHGDYFRVATTLTKFSMEEPPTWVNNVYVLDMNLTIVGSIEGLAKGERIYAARYMGDKMFLVTFRRVDPLFAIDLSDPRNPKVLGKLKIPGYSEYLHPFLDKYLIGVGMDIDEETNRVKGLKVALFDISNITSPKEVSSITFKGHLYSPVLHDHKAFMINMDKQYFAIPVSGSKSGVYIVDIVMTEPENIKLSVRGFIQHHEAQRTLYIEDYVYTASYDLVKIVDEELNTISEIKLI